MSTQLTRKGVPAPSGLARRNTMAFPRELRRAIPDLHTGRILELESVSGRTTNLPYLGPLVTLKLTVKETGKLTGRFVVRMDLQPEAARELAATLVRLAADLEPSA